MNQEQWDKLTNGEKAWKLGQIMCYMNNEDAYYESGWLYIWPDGESYPDCLVDFEDDESYKDLEESFIRHYGDEEFHADGLYSSHQIPTEVIEAAHFWDTKLGLTPIEIIK